MAGEVGSAYVEILADVHNFERDLADKTRKAAEKEGGKTGDSFAKGFNKAVRKRMQGDAGFLDVRAFTRAGRDAAKRFTAGFRSGFTRGFRAQLTPEIRKSFSRAFRAGNFIGEGARAARNFVRGFDQRVKSSQMGESTAKRFLIGFVGGMRRGFAKDLAASGLSKAFRRGDAIGVGVRHGGNFILGFTRALRGIEGPLERQFAEGGHLGQFLLRRTQSLGRSAAFAFRNDFVGTLDRTLGAAIKKVFTNEVGKFQPLRLLGKAFSFRFLIPAAVLSLPALVGPIGNLFNGLVELGGVLAGLPALLTGVGGAMFLLGGQSGVLARALKPVTSAFSAFRAELQEKILVPGIVEGLTGQVAKLNRVIRTIPAGTVNPKTGKVSATDTKVEEFVLDKTGAASLQRFAAQFIANIRQGLTIFGRSLGMLIGGFFRTLALPKNVGLLNRTFINLGDSLDAIRERVLPPLIKLFLIFAEKVSRAFPELLSDFGTFLDKMAVKAEKANLQAIFTRGVIGAKNLLLGLVELTRALRDFFLFANNQKVKDRKPFEGFLESMRSFHRTIKRNGPGITSFFKGLRTVLGRIGDAFSFAGRTLRPLIDYFKSPDFKKGLARIDESLGGKGHPLDQSLGGFIAQVAKLIVDNLPGAITLLRELISVIVEASLAITPLLGSLAALVEPLSDIAKAMLAMPGASTVLSVYFGYKLLAGLTGRLVKFAQALGLIGAAQAVSPGGLPGKPTGASSLSRKLVGGAIGAGLIADSGNRQGLSGLVESSLGGAVAGFVVGGPWGALAGAVGGAVLDGFRQGAKRAAKDQATLDALRTLVASSVGTGVAATTLETLLAGPEATRLSNVQSVPTLDGGMTQSPAALIETIRNLGLAKSGTREFAEALADLEAQGGSAKALADQIRLLATAFNDPIRQAQDFRTAAQNAIRTVGALDLFDAKGIAFAPTQIVTRLDTLLPTNVITGLESRIATVRTLFAKLGPQGKEGLDQLNLVLRQFNMAPLTEISQATLNRLIADMRITALVTGGLGTQLLLGLTTTVQQALAKGGELPSGITRIVELIRANLDPGDTLGQQLLTALDLLISRFDTKLSAWETYARDIAGNVIDIFDGMGAALPDLSPPASSRGTGRSRIPETADGGLFPYTPGGIHRIISEAGDEAVIPMTRPRRALDLLEASGLADLARAASPTPVAGGIAPTVNVYPAAGMSEERLARRVMRQLEGALG